MYRRSKQHNRTFSEATSEIDILRFSIISSSLYMCQSQVISDYTKVTLIKYSPSINHLVPWIGYFIELWSSEYVTNT